MASISSPAPSPPARVLPIVLPPPRRAGGPSLLEALAQRHSSREYSPRPLSLETIGELCWAAFGINRDSGERTVPYWRHVLVMDLYLARADGVWRYDAEAHRLEPYLTADLRAGTGRQDFVAVAPLNLIYVAHGDRMVDISAEDRRLYASVDAAFMGQNVYLYCATAGLGTVFRGAVDYVNLDRKLALPPQSFVTFAQTVGYPLGC
jgi:nitroreductase